MENNEDFVRVNIATPLEELREQELTNRWYFQRLSDKFYDWHFEIEKRINSSKGILILIYASFFVVTIAKISIYVYVSMAYKEDMASSERLLVIFDSVVSGLWVIFAIRIFREKLLFIYVENARLATIVYILICIQYFTFAFWALTIVYQINPYEFGIAAIILYILYGFSTERSPTLLTISVYLVFVCGIFEAIIRLIICQYHNPFAAQDSRPVKKIKFPISAYISSKCNQKSCTICLCEFTEGEKTCGLPCHTDHIFHPQCLKSWLDKKNFCPLCRYSLTSGG